MLEDKRCLQDETSAFFSWNLERLLIGGGDIWASGGVMKSFGLFVAMFFCALVGASGVSAAPSPPLSVDLQAASDTGASDSDDITRDFAAVVDITSATTSETIRVYRGSTLLGEATNVGGTSYNFTFAPGQLAEGINSITARAFDGVEESGDSPALSLVLDTTGPRISDGQPSAAVNVRTGSLAAMSFTFTEEIDFDAGGAGTLTLADVSISGPGGAITPSGITSLSTDSYEVVFPAQTAPGTYSLLVGPDVSDIAGNAMDQDQDGQLGEPSDDIFTFDVVGVDVDNVLATDLSIADGDTTYDGLDLYLDNAIVTVDGAHSFASLQLSSDATLTHTAGVRNLDLTITGDLTIDAGGQISADEKGHGPGDGPGAGEGCNGCASGGGAYGGTGGNSGANGSLSLAGGTPYGSILQPTDLGSGSGDPGAGVGASGGGAIQLDVGGTLTVDGTITAAGGNGANAYTGKRHTGGGGSGGSIYITATTLTGSGSIEANGGIGSFHYWGNSQHGGGGGGGRIAIYRTSDTFAGSITARGGDGFEHGGAGTVYTKLPSQTFGDLLIDNGGSEGATTPLLDPSYTFDAVIVINEGHLEIPVGTTLQWDSSILALANDGKLSVFGSVAPISSSNFSTISIESGGNLALLGTSALDCDSVNIADGSLALSESGTLSCSAVSIAGGELSLSDAAVLTTSEINLLGGTLLLDTELMVPTLYVAAGAEVTHSEGSLGFDLSVTGDLTLEAGGTISADAKGYGPGIGPGAGYSGGAAAGGGFGGKGGDSGSNLGYGFGPGGLAYCPTARLADLGSGSGDPGAGVGAAGGGSLRLSVGGTLLLDGVISANGGDGSNAYNGGRHTGGGGSGGGIHITAETIQGSGTIAAAGGTGSLQYWGNWQHGGGGAGGRIYINTQSDQFSGQVSVIGGPGYEAGEDGTVVSDFPTASLTINKAQLGNLGPNCDIDTWDFFALAGQQIRLTNANSSTGGVVFDLWGPNGWRAFDGLASDSALFTLSETGTYTLIARNTEIATSSAYTFELEETSVTDLTANSTFNGSLEASGQAQLFRVNVTDATPARISLDDLGLGNSVEVYVKLGSAPTRGDYDYRFDQLASGDQTILIPTAAPGDWYILIFAETVNDPSDFNLIMETADIFVQSVSPSHHAAGADTLMSITGLGFDSNVQVSLDDGAGGQYAANSIEVDSSDSLVATFLANTVPIGTYSVVVSKPGGDFHELPDAFEMTEFFGAKLETHLILPERLGYHTPATVWVEYKNAGDVAMPAPLLVLRADQNGREAGIMRLAPTVLPGEFWTSALPLGFSNQIQFLASGDTPGLLQPGESLRVPIQWAGWQQPWFQAPQFDFELGVLDADNSVTVNWPSLKDDMRPNYIPADVWDVIWTNFLNQVGSTWGDYVAALSDNASYLARLGIKETDLRILLGFELDQADNVGPIGDLVTATDATLTAPGLDIRFERTFEDSIRGRYREGSLGKGWSHNWEQSLTVASDGTVTILGPGTSRRIFQPDSRTAGTYFPMKGDHARLTEAAGGGFRLQESDGTVEAFRADGLIDYVEDTNGNRITAAYSGSLLTSLTHSGDQTLTLSYTPANLIQTLTDPDGRTTTFAYDASNEHLTSVQYFDGTTVRYEYSMGVSAQAEHALTQIEFPGGRHQFFSYDTQGRLASVSRDGGAEAITFTYGRSGLVNITNAVGKTWGYYRDQYGRVVRIVDPNGNERRANFDDEFHLASRTDPAGLSHRYTYDANGNLTTSTDPSGHLTIFSYTKPYNRMAQLTDAKGNQTAYSYDAAGNLSSILYANGSAEAWTHDSQGNPNSWTNRRSSTLSYEYDSAGRLTAKVYPDLSRVEYRYDDGRGNLTSFLDSTGTTTLTYYADDRLKRITDPEGRWLQYTYNAAGQRSSMVSHLGHRLDYFYDAVGRLESISDETGTEIVRYHYDAAGRLERKDLQNGVYTLYGYDAASQLTSLVNYRPDDSVLSRFLYTYDTRGRRTSMTTLEGVWHYEYDALGQLTAWTAPNGRRVDYEYDAAGNRKKLTDNNGSVVLYVTDAANQYLQVGSTSYTYDRDGNLIEKESASGTQTLMYDDENQLAAVTDTGSGQNGSYIYNALGFAVKRGGGGSATDYVIDPFGLGNVVEEYDDSSGNLVAYYDYGIGLVERVDSGGSPLAYTFDAAGNTSELTRDAGLPGNSYSYDPFGNPIVMLEPLANPFTFAGAAGVVRADIGTVFMRGRFYDPASGRFLSADPIGFSGGDPNLYRYVFNNPVTFLDPSGRQLWNQDDLLQGKDTLHQYLYRGWTNVGKKALSSNLWRSAAVGGAGCAAGVIFSAVTGFIGAAPACAVGFTLSDFANFVNSGNSLLHLPLPPTNAANVGTTASAGSFDPNHKGGPGGYGQFHLVNPTRVLPYRIDFENDAQATAPAQTVTMEDQLSSGFDLATFELTEIGFGDTRIPVPPGTQHFETSVPMSYGGTDFEVQIDVGLHLGTGQLYANFYSIDPDTGLPPPVDTGFLPPEDGTGRGQGYFSYIIRAKPDLPEGTEIRNVALITFDYQETIATNQVDPHDPSQGTDPGKEALVTIAPANADLTVASTSGGSVTGPGEGTFTYDWGASIALTAVPDPGFDFVGWTGDVGTLGDPSAATTAIGAYDDFFITANFAPTPPKCVAPLSGCGVAEKELFKIRAKEDPTKNRVLWKWLRGTTDIAQFGDPTLDTSYVLCVYVDGAPIMEAAIESGDNWSSKRRGYKYKNKEGNSDGIFIGLLKEGVGKAKILVKGRGKNLAMPTLPLNPSSDVTVQLVRDPEEPTECWEAVFTPPFKVDTETRFKDKEKE